ncbi:AraC family transcriptional regulator [Labilibacter marinus]|uniref:AraC family transcriptional regulator n=1 Tax=Labilibacter marinus TaxID=1477105 RepID=UPI00082D496C|nr:helix-turn-helix domain-containing protein [Labilibacter marinus]
MVYDQLNALIVILIFGSLVLLSFVKLANPLGINKKGNQWFALFLMMYASFWLEEIALYAGFGDLNPIVLIMVHGLQIFTPVVLLTSILSYSNPNFKLKPKHAVHVIVPLIYFAVLVYGHVQQSQSPHGHILAIVIILSLSSVYAVVSYFKIRRHQKSILLYSSNAQGINLNWLEYILLQVIVICIIIILHNIFVSTRDVNLLVNTTQFVTVFSIAYFSFRQREIFPIKENQKDDLNFIIEEQEPDKIKKKLLGDDDLERLKKKLNHLMQEERLYLDSELNLVRLAEKMTITPHQLSYLINSGYNENFFQFVNRYRVDCAKELLLSEEKLTMLAVAFDSGFNSKTSFNTTFKKLTQQTPSEYRKSSSGL